MSEQNFEFDKPFSQNFRIKIETFVTDLTVDSISQALAETLGPGDALCEEIYNQADKENDENYKYFTEATLMGMKNTLKLKYNESADMGLDGCTTILEFHSDEPELLTMVRSGQSHASLSFKSNGEIQQCSYGAPPYCMTFGIYTRELKVNINPIDGGKIYVDYIIMLNGRSLERNRLSIILDKV